MWSKQLAQLWKNRADSYEEGNDRNAISGGNDSDGSTTSSNDNSNKDDKLIDSAAINESYDNVLKDCESEGMHLLPQVVSPVDNTTENEVTNMHKGER